MPSRQCCHLIKKEQRCVTMAHLIVVHALVMELTANPVRAGPAPLTQCLVITVEFATTIAEHDAPRRNGKNLTAWMNAILQGHFSGVPEQQRELAASTNYGGQCLRYRVRHTVPW